MTQVPPGVPQAGQPKASGMAVASLICGVVGLCTAGLGGIPGLVLGLVALKRISRSNGPAGGKGLALAGTILSALGLLLLLVLAADGLIAHLRTASPEDPVTKERVKMVNGRLSIIVSLHTRNMRAVARAQCVAKL